MRLLRATQQHTLTEHLPLSNPARKRAGDRMWALCLHQYAPAMNSRRRVHGPKPRVCETACLVSPVSNLGELQQSCALTGAEGRGHVMHGCVPVKVSLICKQTSSIRAAGVCAGSCLVDLGHLALQAGQTLGHLSDLLPAGGGEIPNSTAQVLLPRSRRVPQRADRGRTAVGCICNSSPECV